MKRIGMLTGGGDCAGLNAALRGAAQCLIQNHSAELVGIEDGFLGLIERRCRPLIHSEICDVIDEGGTLLGACNKASPLAWKGQNVAARVKAYYDELGLDGIIALGGDGTMSLCHVLASEYDMAFVGVPKTIDNDLMHTEQTFGFDSAVSVVVEAIDRLHTTAKSHHRAMIVETMGRYAGWIALYSGQAGNANVILIPELDYSIQKVADVVNQRAADKLHTIIVVAEGAKPQGGEVTVSQTVMDSPEKIRLGGVGYQLQTKLEPLVDVEIRTTALGHVQRGGTPTAADRILATNYGFYAAQLVMQNQLGYMVCLQNGEYTHTPLSAIAGQTRYVPQTHPVFRSAKACGIAFGV